MQWRGQGSPHKGSSRRVAHFSWWTHLDHCGMCHLPPIVLINHHRLSSGFDTVISLNMACLNTFLDYLMGCSSQVVQYLNHLKPSTATSPHLLIGFWIIMFPLAAWFSSALALPQCFGAMFRSFRSTIPSQPLKRLSLLHAILPDALFVEQTHAYLAQDDGVISHRCSVEGHQVFCGYWCHCLCKWLTD